MFNSILSMFDTMSDSDKLFIIRCMIMNHLKSNPKDANEINKAVIDGINLNTKDINDLRVLQESALMLTLYMLTNNKKDRSFMNKIQQNILEMGAASLNNQLGKDFIKNLKEYIHKVKDDKKE